MLALRKKFFILSIHPLFLATLCLMAGIAFQSLGWSFYWAFALFCAICFIGYWHDSFYLLILACAFLTGSALYQKTLNKTYAFHNVTFEKKNDVILTITDIEQSNHRFLKHRITGAINEITTSKNSVFPHGSQNFLWYTYKNPALKIGDIVKFESCSVSLPKQESIQQFFLKQQIIGTINPQRFQIIYRPFMHGKRWLFEQRANLIKKLKKKLSIKSFNFMALLFFGNKEINKKNLETLKADFKGWGLSHYLARSGLHLIIFIFLWEALLKLLPLSYLLKHLIMCLLTIIYVLFSWSSLSFMRSLATFFLYKYGLLFEMPIHPVHAITVITFFSLFFNPCYLFALDFQLSFGITFLLTWANHIQLQQTFATDKNS